MNIFMKQSRPKQFGGVVTEYSFEEQEGFHPVKYAMMQLYTDVEPYEIIEVKGKRLLVRLMNSEQINKLVCHVGGFAGHIENSGQEWVMTPNDKAEPFWLSLRKDGKFRRFGGNTKIHYWLDEEPIKFYDYNF